MADIFRKTMDRLTESVNRPKPRAQASRLNENTRGPRRSTTVQEAAQLFREQSDIKSYIVYTQAIKDTLWAPALVTQSKTEASRISDQMKKAGYAGVMVVESPLMQQGLSAPQLMDPGKKFKIVDSVQRGPLGTRRRLSESRRRVGVIKKKLGGK